MTALPPALTPVRALPGLAVLAQKIVQARLTYRVAALVSLTASAFAYGVFLLVWREVYRENPHPGPLTREQMMAYLVSAFLVNAILTLSVEFRFLQRLRSGLVASDLVRPVSFVSFQLAQAVGDSVGNLVYAAPIYLVGFWLVGPALLPASAWSFVFAVVSVALAFTIGFGLSFLIVQASFVLQSGYGVFFARAALHQVFSGLSAPLLMFPPGLRNVAEWLPFHYEIEAPARIWLGLVPPAELPRLLAAQAAWGLGLIVVGDFAFRAAVRRHQVQGG